MASYDVITDMNSYHGIQTTYAMPGMPKAECSTCAQHQECKKQPAWIKLCESVAKKQQKD